MLQKYLKLFRCFFLIQDIIYDGNCKHTTIFIKLDLLVKAKLLNRFFLFVLLLKRRTSIDIYYDILIYITKSYYQCLLQAIDINNVINIYNKEMDSNKYEVGYYIFSETRTFLFACRSLSHYCRKVILM